MWWAPSTGACAQDPAMLGVAGHQDNPIDGHTGAMRVVGLLRGVNLGPSRKLKMADLRAAVESLGHTDVETYLQSGNVVFTPQGRATGPRRRRSRRRCATPSASTSTCSSGPAREMAADRGGQPVRRRRPDEGGRDVPRRAGGAPARTSTWSVRPGGPDRPRHRGLPAPPGRSGPLEADRRPGQDRRPATPGDDPQLAHRRGPGRDDAPTS